MSRIYERSERLLKNVIIHVKFLCQFRLSYRSARRVDSIATSLTVKVNLNKSKQFKKIILHVNNHKT